MLKNIAAGLGSMGTSISNAFSRGASTTLRSAGHTMASSPTGLTSLALKAQNQADALGHKGVDDSAQMFHDMLSLQSEQAKNQMKAEMIGGEIQQATAMLSALVKQMNKGAKAVADAGPGGNG